MLVVCAFLGVLIRTVWILSYVLEDITTPREKSKWEKWAKNHFKEAFRLEETGSKSLPKDIDFFLGKCLMIPKIYR